MQNDKRTVPVEMMKTIGSKYQKMSFERKRIVISALRQAGIDRIEQENKSLGFGVYMGNDQYYYLEIAEKGKTVYIHKNVCEIQNQDAIHSLLWYINTRNAELKRNHDIAEYVLNQNCLQIKYRQSLHGRSCDELIRTMIRLFQIEQRDLDNMEILAKGKVPESVHAMIETEYLHYKREFENGTDI